MTIRTAVTSRAARLRSPRTSEQFARRRAGRGTTTVALALVATIVVGGAVTTAESAPAAAAGTPWTPLYSEDFARNAPLGQFGAVYGRNWLGYAGARDTSRRGVYTPDRVLSVSNSALDIWLRTENGTPLTAAPMPSGYNGQTYGRYSIRLRADSIPGFKIAFMLWPVSNNWSEGEIDFPEGYLSGGRFYGASKLKGSGSNWDPGKSYAPTSLAGWHTATIEWTPGSVKWFWDNALIGQTRTASGVPTTPMRWVLQAETLDVGGTVPSSAAGHVQVDWVQAWRYTP